MSALWSPRSLSRTQPPVKRKTKRSSWHFSLSISCAASTKILRRTASLDERVRVGWVVTIAEDVIVWCIIEMSTGVGEDVLMVAVVVVVYEMRGLLF